jgi:hypothetical protein
MNFEKLKETYIQHLIIIPMTSFDYTISGRYLISYKGDIREASYNSKEVAFRLLCKPDTPIRVPDVSGYSYLGKLN